MANTKDSEMVGSEKTSLIYLSLAQLDATVLYLNFKCLTCRTLGDLMALRNILFLNLMSWASLLVFQMFLVEQARLEIVMG